MIMNQPTIFGYNAKSNQFLAGGEAGSETVVGTQSLMDMIRVAVNEENASLLEKLDRILTKLYAFHSTACEPETGNRYRSACG